MVLADILRGVVTNPDNYALEHLAGFLSPKLVLGSNGSASESMLVAASTILSPLYLAICITMALYVVGYVTTEKAKYGSGAVGGNFGRKFTEPHNLALVLFTLTMLTPVPLPDYNNVTLGQYLGVRTIVTGSNIADFLNKTFSEASAYTSDEKSSNDGLFEKKTTTAEYLRTLIGPQFVQSISSFECVHQLIVDGYDKRNDSVDLLSKTCGVPADFISKNIIAKNLFGQSDTTQKNQTETVGASPHEYFDTVRGCYLNGYVAAFNKQLLSVNNNTIAISAGRVNQWGDVGDVVTQCIISDSAVSRDSAGNVTGTSEAALNAEMWRYGWSMASLSSSSYTEAKNDDAVATLAMQIKNVPSLTPALSASTVVISVNDDTMATVKNFSTQISGSLGDNILSSFKREGRNSDTDMKTDGAGTYLGAATGAAFVRAFKGSKGQPKTALQLYRSAVKSFQTFKTAFMGLKISADETKIITDQISRAAGANPISAMLSSAWAIARNTLIMQYTAITSPITYGIWALDLAFLIPHLAIGMAFVVWVVRSVSTFLLLPINLIFLPVPDTRVGPMILKHMVSVMLYPVFVVIFYHIGQLLHYEIGVIAYDFTVKGLFANQTIFENIATIVTSEWVLRFCMWIVAFFIGSIFIGTLIYKGPDYALRLMGLDGDHNSMHEDVFSHIRGKTAGLF